MTLIFRDFETIACCNNNIIDLVFSYTIDNGTELHHVNVRGVAAYMGRPYAENYTYIQKFFAGAINTIRHAHQQNWYIPDKIDERLDFSLCGLEPLSWEGYKLILN